MPALATDLSQLSALLPAGALVTDPDVLETYRQDQARDPAASRPAAVVRAGCTADVSAVLAFASARGVPVVPRGAGSGLSGGASGVAGGIVLTTERMRDLRIDPASRVAVAQPGVLNADVKRAAAQHGLWYPPDPSSYEISTIGGNVATNAGGLCCVKYGVTRDYVLGLEVVLADGTPVRLGGSVVKDVAGLPLTQLFVGSEGILGVVTEVTLRLVPLPPPFATLVAMFPTVQQAADAVVDIASAMRPSMLELMDRTAIVAVDEMLAMGLDRDAGALLLARSDAPGAAALAEVTDMERRCAALGATEHFVTDDPDEGEAFAVARRSALPAMEGRGALLLEDVAVPIPQLPAMMTGVERIAAETGAAIAVVAHAGDGNVHPVIVEGSDDATRAAARRAFDAIMALAIELGGTITGEHGVGRLKAAWLPQYLGGDALALNRRVKDALDPAGILNPGALLPRDQGD